MIVASASILFGFGLSLTPQVLNAVERLKAMGQLRSGNLPNGRWLIMILVAILSMMIVALIGVSYNRIQRERRRVTQAFLDNIRRRSLGSRECQLIQEIIRRSGLGPYQRNMIFTSAPHFERGVERVTQEVLRKQGPDAHARLTGEVAFLREKLGFRDRSAKEWLNKSTAKTRLTTRDIPVGQTLHITRRLGQQSDNLQAQVVGNDATQLTLGLQRPLRITFGEAWRVRYFHGASVWEFDTTVASFDGSRLVLKHSNEVRFINRRRFVRVPARNLAFIAPFPFARSLSEAGVDPIENWRPLEFVHALVTELAGPGLRVEAPLQVQVGQRVLVLFRLDRHPDGAAHAESGARLIEDIAVVRRIEAIQNSYSIALEMVGLRDSDIDELVRATNQAAADQGVGPAEGPVSKEPLQQDGLVETIVEKGT